MFEIFHDKLRTITNRYNLHPPREVVCYQKEKQLTCRGAVDDADNNRQHGY